MIRINQLSLALCASAVLVACGGGGSNSVGTITPPAALVTAAYGGTWKDISPVSLCGNSDITQTNATGANLKRLAYVTITPLTDTTLSIVSSFKHFAPSDTTCAGTVLITETLTPFVIRIDGTATVGGQLVDKTSQMTTSISHASLVIGNTIISNSTLGASAATINGYYFYPGYFNPEPQSTNKGYLRVTATNLYCDNRTGTPNTYPIAMNAAACYVKI